MSQPLSWKTREAAPEERGKNQPIDPYLQWALTSEFRGYGDVEEFSDPRPENHWVSFVAKAKSVRAMDDFLERYAYSTDAAAVPCLFVPPIYWTALKGTEVRPTIFTGRVRRCHLDKLLACEEIESFELGLPVRAPGTIASNDSAARVTTSAARPKGSPPKKVIGVIDYGGPFLHPGFLDETGQTRYFSVWDQGETPFGAWWYRPSEFDYGREIDSGSIDVLRTQMLAGPGKDASQVYAELEYTLDRDDKSLKRVLRDTHGAHVSDMFAGTQDPLIAVRKSRGAPLPKDASVDAAGKSKIIFVQIPLQTLVDSSGGSLNVHILDGIRYIVDRAEAKASVVINVSYGQHAGPHDGSSMLEQAMDQIIKASEERVVLVIGAGNGREDQAHAELRLTDSMPETLRWNVPPNDATDSFLEIWYPMAVANLPTQITLRVKPPDGNWSPEVGCNSEGAVLSTEDGTAVAQLIHAPKVPNGIGPMALLSLAPTRVAPGAAAGMVAAPTGIWEVQIATTMPGSSVPIHAWIEREHMPDTLARSEFLTHVSPACTVNGIATGKYCVVVGGIRSSDGQPLPYSGIGPTRDPTRTSGCPVTFGECEESEALFGIRAGTMRPGDTLRMGGTSVAAPAAARLIFNNVVAAQGTREPKTPLQMAMALINGKADRKLR